MTDRSVSVSLRMKVRDYIAGGSEAIAMNKRLQASQRELGNESGRTAEQLTKVGNAAERHGRSTGRGALYAAAGVGALGLAGGGLKALPPLLAATAAGAAVLPQVLLGSAAAGGVLKVALGGVGDAMKKVGKDQEKFQKSLAPNAELLVSQYARIRPALQGLQQDLQQRALAGTAQGLDLFATKTLPRVSGGLVKIADDWSAFFAEVALTANSPEFVGAFNGVTSSADRFFDQINDRIRPLGKSFATLLTSADPVARAFGDGLVGMLDRFNAAIERARASGDLSELFAGATESARELMSISGDVLRITGMVIREASSTNSATTSAGQSLRAYVESGRAAGDVAGVVHTLTVAWEGLRDVLGPIGALLRDALADPGVAASIGQTFAVMAAGTQVLDTVLRVLLALNQATGGVLLPLIGLAIASGKLTAAITATTAAAARGSAALSAYGAAGAKAGSALSVGAAGAGKLVSALFLLEAAHAVFASFDKSAADVAKLDAAVRSLAAGGAIAGTEIDRVFNKGFGDLAAQAQLAAPDDLFGKMLSGLEDAIPLTGDLARLLGSPSFAQSRDNFAALDAQVSKYAQSTGDLKGTTEAWNKVIKESGLDQGELQKLLPGTAAEMTRLQTATHALETGMGGAAQRAALLAAPLNEAVTAARSLLDVFTELNGGAIGFARAQLAAESAVDALTEGLDKNGLALNRTRDGFNILTEKGAANQGMLLDVAEAAAKAAQARIDEGGSVAQAAGVYDQYINRLRAALAAQGATPAQIDAIIGKYAELPASLQAAGAAATDLSGQLNSIPKGTKFRFDGKSLVDGKGNTVDLKDGIRGIPPGKTFTWNGKSLVDGKGKAYAVKEAVEAIPGSKSVRVNAQTGQALSAVRTLQNVIGAVHSKTVTLTVRANTSSANAAEHALNRKRWGGVTYAAAGGGVFQPEIVGPGTRIRWAEPETGGEAYIPRRGDPGRSRQILDVAAGWYGMRAVPMRAGGIVSAATGQLVNVAPSGADPTKFVKSATRLDYVESYLRARDAAKALSAALKENGRSFSFATQKGRENRSAVVAGIRAAQDAAKTKYEETGSVKAANAAYDEHIRRLNATLKAQKVSAATRKSLLSVASRPAYDLPDKKPTNSGTNVDFTRSLIALLEGSGDLADKLSLNQPGTSVTTENGRENLSAILDYLGLAQKAAQDRYAQTKNAKTATAFYNTQITELTKILKAAGYASGTITSLIKTYGRITLVPNERGGAYMAAGGLASLSTGRLFPAGGATMYGFAEPGTGGELFVPRNGDRQRGQDLLQIGAGWYGGRFVPGGGSTSTSTQITNNLTVQPMTAHLTISELRGLMQQLDAQARVGRPG